MIAWKELKLKDCMTIKHGKSQHSVANPDGQYPILGTGGEIGRAAAYLYNKPSVLIGRKGTIDKPRYIDSPFWTVDTLFYSEIKPNAVPKYLYYLFLTINWHKYNEASGVPSLSASTISNIKILLPPLAEQTRIVEILEVWDEYIDKLDKKIKLKKSIKKGLMQQLLTGNKRLPGHSAEWEQVKIGSVASIKKGKSLSSGEILPGDYPVIAGGKTSPYAHAKYTDENCITVSASGAYAGFVAYHPRKIWASDCSVVQGIPTKSDTKYLYFLLKHLQNKIYLMQTGGAQPHIYPNDLTRLKTVFPPSLDEQLAITKILDVATEEIELLASKKSALELQKKFLLNNLTTGAISVCAGKSTMHNVEVEHAI